jgi:GNAT superfamily N-acetyltransferase
MGTPADAAAVVRIWNQAPRTKGETRRRTRADYVALRRVAQLAVAERNGKPIGTITLLGPDASDSLAEQDELEVSSLAVAAAERGQGIEQLLLSWAEGQTARSGVRRLVVWIPVQQPATREIYRALGYARLPGREKGNHGRPRGLFYARRLPKPGRSLAAIRSRA